MKGRIQLGLLLCLNMLVFQAVAQVIEYDTSSREPFFKARHFNSSAHATFEAGVSHMFTNKVVMLTGASLNWVVNKRYVTTARFHTLTSQVNIQSIATPHVDRPLYLQHYYAGLSFSYIFFADKIATLQPEIGAGWACARFEYPDKLFQRQDYGAILPGVQTTFNLSKIIRLGLGVHYRAVFGSKFFDLRSEQLNGVSGSVSLKVGKF